MKNKEKHHGDTETVGENRSKQSYFRDRNNSCIDQSTEQTEISWKYRNKNITKVARKMYPIDANVWETTEGKKITNPNQEKALWEIYFKRQTSSTFPHHQLHRWSQAAQVLNLTPFSLKRKWLRLKIGNPKVNQDNYGKNTNGNVLGIVLLNWT